MKPNDFILEGMRNDLNISVEQEQEILRQLEAQNPIPPLLAELDQVKSEKEQLEKRLEFAEEALLFLMEMGNV